jgi:hypothetical protein
LLNDSMLLCSGDCDSDYKIALLHLPSGNITEQLIPYSSNERGVVSRETKSAYESYLFVKPSGDKCVLACRYADQIEIVDISQKTSKIIRGPEGFTPDVVAVTDILGKRISTRGESTRYAFLGGQATDRFIYLLYSGNNHQTEHLYYGRYLYVYDWNGRPIQRLEFKSDVLRFAVSADDKRLYAYHPGDNSLTVSAINE